MKTMSSISAAFGVVEFEALNDLADFLDGRIEPAASHRESPSPAGDPARPAAARSAGWDY
jgi:hypothetical protein